jgi:uncharacterized membrane protein
MSDFDPVTLFFILHESIGIWLWLLLGLAGVLLAGIAVSALKLRRAGRPATRPVVAALIVGAIATVAATFAVPGWTLADPGALGPAVDYAFAILFALVPGVIVGAFIFMLAADRCVRRGAVAA